MEFKYALSLLFSNMGYVIRIFVWVLIAMIITACIGAAVLVPVFDALGEAPEVADAFRTLTGELDSFLDDGMSIREFISSIPAAVGGLVAAVVGESGLCAALAFTAIFLYALYSFIVSLSYYPTAYSVKQLMSSNMPPRAECRSRCPSTSRSSSSPCSSCGGCSRRSECLRSPSRSCSASSRCRCAAPSSGAGSRGCSLWKVRVCTRLSDAVCALKGLMKAFVITFFAAFALMAGLSVPTFGLVIVVIPSIDYFLFRTIELVGYYKMTGMSFYTDAANVVDTVEFGYRAENQARLSEEDSEE